MKSRGLLVWVLIALAASLALSACSRPLASGGAEDEPTTTEEPTQPPSTGEPVETNEAIVESVEVAFQRGRPVQVNAIVRGSLPDACVAIDLIDVQGPGGDNTFTIKIFTKRDPLALCAEALTPFEQTVILPTEGLENGTYTVEVEGTDVSTPFELGGAPMLPGGNFGVLYIDSVDALILESFPVQVNAVVRGNFADGCTTLADVQVSGPENNVFTISMIANRNPEAMCTQALVPFEETVSLPVAGLPAGTYTIRVNGEAETTFELAVDNGSAAAEGQAEDLASLIAALEAQGMVVVEGDMLEQDFFAVAPQILKVENEDVQVFEFENDADAEAAANSVTGAGSMITLPDGRVIQIDWMSAPHWFQSGRLVVLYVGDNADILAALEAALGPQIFGE